MEAVDAVEIYDAPWMKAATPRIDSRPDLDFIERLRGSRFDAAVIFTVYSQSPLPAAFACALADIPLRLAYCHENPYQLLTHWVRDPEPGPEIRHEVQRQLDLVSSIGAGSEDPRMRIRISSGARSIARDVLARAGIVEDRPWVLIHPGASAPSRRYPAESFAEAARRLYLDRNCPIVLTGGPDEKDLVEEVRARMEVPSISLAGAVDLETLAAVIERAWVVISNNTGPAHIAAAVGTPIVDLYALTNPQHTPWMVPNRVLNYDVPCKFCYKSVCPEGHHGCLRFVPPLAVVEAAGELMQDRLAYPPPAAAPAGRVTA